MTVQPPGVQDKTDDTGTPSAIVVNKFHLKSDVDSQANAQHHTLGPRAGQASPGTHKHDGKNSQQLLAGVTLTGAKGGSAVITSIVAALVALGATDSTT